VIGINDLYTSNPEIKILLKDKNKGYSLTKGSGKKEIFKCPDCGHEKLKTVRDVVNYGYSCPRCSDGLSYPEKIMLNILDQLNINFECQKTFKWSENRRYDFYIPSLNMIIETHGRQHYEDSFNSVKEEQINDEIKERLAKDNEIKHYIIIDCRVSDVHFIKENILNSKLNLLFDISKIDWKQCHEFACNSLIKTASDLWNKGIKSSITIAKMLKLARTTINRYLKQGAELGWSDYDPKRAQRENAQKRSETNKKQIIQLSTENKLIKEWDSIKSASEFLMVNTSSISNVLRKYRKTAYGFKWMYKEDYDQYIKQAN
jgi:transposase/predicted RNA-binding Zn-ribbon protein involved in translation (DUF1610 family)